MNRIQFSHHHHHPD
ncbi:MULTISPECIES: his operon leader peptide [Xenorhabdus]|nr:MULTISPECIES: his operon leader peptide [Xenorhabdus]MCC8381403.1 his operon leader peptide [Xenorhabdus sp. PB30.3]MCG3469667.1 his operon leader peptide [Xenorhabdus bovienii]